MFFSLALFLCVVLVRQDLFARDAGKKKIINNNKKIHLISKMLMYSSGDLNADSICTRSKSHESGKQTSKLIASLQIIEGFNFTVYYLLVN